MPSQKSIGKCENDGLDLAGGVGAEHLDGIGLREIGRAVPVKHRHAGRAWDADRRQFLDMVTQGGFVPPGPAGHDQRSRLDIDLVVATLRTAVKSQHGHLIPMKNALQHSYVGGVVAMHRQRFQTKETIWP